MKQKGKFKTLAIILLGIVFIFSASEPTEARTVRWKMSSVFPTSIAFPWSSANRFAEELNRLSNGDIKVKPFPAGALMQAFEVFDAVKKGDINAGWAPSIYWETKIPGISLFSTMPFSLSAEEHYNWLRNGGGLALYEKFYAKHGLKAIPAAMFGPDGFGWFRQPINNINDLRGLKIRMLGYDGKVIDKLGARSIKMPGGEIFPGFERGSIDGANFATP